VEGDQLASCDVGDVKLDAGVGSFEWESWSDIAWLEVRDAFDMFATDKMSVVQRGGSPRSKPNRQHLHPLSSFPAEP